MTKSSTVAHAQPSPMPNGNVDLLPTTNYFEQRLMEVGLERSTAKAHGLAEESTGAMLQYCRTYDGKIRYFTPQYGPIAKKLKRLQQRKTFTGIDPDQFDRPLAITRYTPEQLAADPEKPRYKLWSKKFTGIPTLPLPNNVAIQNYQNQIIGGTIVFTEGYLKSVAAAVREIEMSAFSGNTHFDFCETVEEYIDRRQPDNIVLLLDGDALDLHAKKRELSSKRLQGFYAGIHKFAARFFDWQKRKGTKINLYLAIIQPEQPKGFDDLFTYTKTEQHEEILQTFQSLRTSSYFKFTKLSRTTFKKTLKHIFYLHSYQVFYEQFATQIGHEAFKFDGFYYQCINAGEGRQLSLLQKETLPPPPPRQFRLLSDPFAIDIPTTSLTIKKYLGNVRSDLNILLSKYERLAIESPTGSGKTTFFIQQLKRNRQRAVITVPTVNLAKQLAAKHGILALYGSRNLAQKVAALNAPIIVCTYDTLHHIEDLNHRWLIVDEAHNLVNHFGQVLRVYRPFRADTLRFVLEAMEQVKKTILLSGTMNLQLCQALDCHLVQVQRIKNQCIHVTQLAATSAKDQTALLIDELNQVDFQDNKIHFVYYNSNKQLQLIQEQLVQQGVLTTKDIAIITRDVVKAGQHQVFKEIIEREQIKSPVKLILSTCLIAEGINIKNQNIGKIYTVNVKCLDSFRQYVARFRALQNLEVIAITPPEKKLRKAFRHYPQKFAKKWRAFKTSLELSCYHDKQYRKYLSPLHRLELRFLTRIKKKVISAATVNGKVSATLLQNQINSMLQYHRYHKNLERPIIERYANLSPNEIENRLNTVFMLEKEVYTNQVEYEVLLDYTVAMAGKRNMEFIPFCQFSIPNIWANPLKILDLYH